ncbi:MAG: hypothetical protein ACOC53_05765 [Candidatus Saliniplasma sp.]
MLILDTSAFISLGICGCVEILLDEFDIHTSCAVIDELKDMSGYNDLEADVAERWLEKKDLLNVHDIGKAGEFDHKKIDRGKGSCAVLARKMNAKFLITDDIRALPLLKNIASTKVAISPIVMKALVKRGLLSDDEAKNKLEKLIDKRDWFETPIYERSLELFEDDSTDG